MSIGDAPTMDTKRVHIARDEWRKFLTSCLVKRVDPDQFLLFAEIHQTKWPVPPMMVADLLFRPTPRNCYVPDMLVPQYVQRLLKKKIITASTVLCALYRYSTTHTQLELGSSRLGDENKADEEKTKTPKPLRWAMSWRMEDILYYDLTKAIRQEGVLQSTKDALDLVRIVSKWTTLLSELTASLAPTDVMGVAMQSTMDSNTKQEVDATTSAFVLLLLGICEDAFILRALSRSAAKETRRQLSLALVKFAPYLPHQSPDIGTRLEMFRTQTLAGLEPVDKKKHKDVEDANAQAFEDFDQTMGLDSFQVTELPVVNTRAGLYIYLNAALVGLPSIDDAALFSFLHNRYQVHLLHLLPGTGDIHTNWHRSISKRQLYT